MSLVQEIKVPLLAVNDTTLTVVEKSFSNGDRIRKGDIILVFETSKTTYDVPSEVEGFIQYLCETGEDYEVNDIVARVYSEVTDIVLDKPPLKSDPVKTAVAAAITEGIKWEGETLYSAEAEHLITVGGIDRSLFKGKDLVSKEDVEMILGKKPAPSAIKPAPAKQKTIAVDTSKVIVQKLTAGKKREIEYLGEVQNAGLTSTINAYVETEGIFVHVNKSLKFLRNSLLPLVIYEGSRLLKKFPSLNAYFAGDGIAHYNEINIGFAADMEQGLKVLKVAHSNEKSLGEIESDIMQLSERYLENKLLLEDLTDVTFTVTDLSAEGAAFFQPLVNMMNSAILGISAIDEKLQRVTLSLTFDHRVTEGKPVAQYLQQLKERLESYRAKVLPSVNDIACYKCSKTLSEDLGKIGFVKCVTPEGREEYLCQSCLKGF